MSEWGVFAVDRGIWDHPVLNDDKEPLSKREAWMWLLSAAAWKPLKVGHGGGVVTIARGEFCFSLRFLADKFRWQKSRVERFLEKLEKHDMIRDADRDDTKVYKVTNYNEYQRVGLPDRDADRDTIRDATGTASGQHRDKEETFKHSNIEEPSLRDGSAPEPEAKPVSKPVSKPKAERGTRWPDDAVVSDAWIADGITKRKEMGLEPIDLRYEAFRFANYWASKSGGRAIHSNWHCAWLNWATDKDKTGKKHQNNGTGKPTAHDRHLAGIGMLISGEDDDEFSRHN